MKHAATAACLFLAAALSYSEAATRDGLAPPEARIVRIESRADGSDRWIETETEFVALFPLPLREVAAVPEDYASYPRYVPHLKRTDVYPRDGSNALIQQHYEIAILGYRYKSEYYLDIDVDASLAPARWVQRWRLAESDGSIGASAGEWVLEDVGTPGSPATRVTHRNRGLVRQSFPLQARIMRSVAERELGRSIAAVRDEARNRASPKVAARQYP